MKMNKQLSELIARYPELTAIRSDIWSSYELMRECYEQNRKILFAGNGGSGADAEHIVGELMKGFVKNRRLPDQVRDLMCSIHPEKGGRVAEHLQGALAAIALTGHPSLATAFLNDIGGDYIFAQQTYGYGQSGDILFAITTSGNAKNIEYACIAAKSKGMKIIGLTGRDGGVLKQYCDTVMIMPEMETYKIQELHLPVYHCLCLMLEDHFFDE